MKWSSTLICLVQAQILIGCEGTLMLQWSIVVIASLMGLLLWSIVVIASRFVIVKVTKSTVRRIRGRQIIH